MKKCYGTLDFLALYVVMDGDICYSEGKIAFALRL